MGFWLSVSQFLAPCRSNLTENKPNTQYVLIHCHCIDLPGGTTGRWTRRHTERGSKEEATARLCLCIHHIPLIYPLQQKKTQSTPEPEPVEKQPEEYDREKDEQDDLKLKEDYQRIKKENEEARRIELEQQQLKEAEDKRRAEEDKVRKEEEAKLMQAQSVCVCALAAIVIM